MKYERHPENPVLKTGPSGWKIFGLSSLGMLLVGIILLFLFIWMISATLGAFGDRIEKLVDGESKPLKVQSNSVLRLSLKGTLGERSYNELDPFSFSTNRFTGIYDFSQAINAAKKDKKIKGILLDLNSVQIGTSTLWEVRSKLEEFKKSGKFVYSYADGYSQKAYYLASVADSIFMYPQGYLEFKGISANYIYYTDALTAIGVKAQVIRGSNNHFKSAVEPYFLREMSDSSRFQTQQLLNGIWGTMLKDIASSRGVSVEELQEIADSVKIRTGEDAVKHKLVDRLIYFDELESRFIKKFNWKSKLPKWVKFNRYAAKIKKKSKKKKKNIAVLYANGGIAGGNSDFSSIGSSTFVKALKKIRTNKKIKGLVVRVNSPGGEVVASDLIWREIGLIAKDIPVVVSMGNYAASGGYFISCPADYIMATPMTITGSIGVFAVIPDAQELLEDKLNLHQDGVKTAEHADISYLDPSLGMLTKPLSPDALKIFQEGVDYSYQDFLKRVKDSRGFNSLEDVHEIARGRVWLGPSAKKNGLVDEIGNLEDAISKVKKMAKLKNAFIDEYPKKPKNILANLVKAGEDELESTENSQIRYQRQFLDLFWRMKSPQAIFGKQFRSPFILEIE